jgi:hypothetical protein
MNEEGREELTRAGLEVRIAADAARIEGRLTDFLSRAPLPRLFLARISAPGA